MSISRVTESPDEGLETVVGWISEIKADAGGFLITLTDGEGDDVVVRVSRKLMKGVDATKILWASGGLHKNESGRRWMTAEDVGSIKGETLSDEEAANIQSRDAKNTDRKNRYLDFQALPSTRRRPKTVSASERMADAFSQLQDKLRK